MGSSESKRQAEEEKIIKKITETEGRMSDDKLRLYYPELGLKRITRKKRKELVMKEAKRFHDLMKKLDEQDSLEAWKRTLYEWRDTIYAKVKIPRRFKDPAHPSLEVFINLMLVGLAFIAPWEAWFSYFPDFRTIVIKAIGSKKARTTIIGELANAVHDGYISKEVATNFLRWLINYMGVSAPELVQDIVVAASRFGSGKITAYLTKTGYSAVDTGEEDSS
jgi:hypothetical protein